MTHGHKQQTVTSKTVTIRLGFGVSTYSPCLVSVVDRYLGPRGLHVQTQDSSSQRAERLKVILQFQVAGLQYRSG